MPDRAHCARQARQAGEAVHGTASRARRWILLEQPGPWGADLPEDSDLPAAVSAHLRDLQHELPARILLLRRPFGAQPARRTLFVGATPVGGGGWLERFELDRPEELCDLDLAPLARGRSVGGAPVTRRQYLVCTNGSHDACCAEFGLPVVRALASQLPTDLWECSHVGGDRFAGNLVVLPDGHFYGRLDATTALAVVHSAEQDRIELQHWRGDCALPFPLQAAESHLRLHLDLRDARHVAVLERHLRDDRHEVVFRLPDGRQATVVVADRDRLPPRSLTCATSPQQAPAWRLLDLRVEPAPTPNP